jgi:hypothetical protein
MFRLHPLQTSLDFLDLLYVIADDAMTLCQVLPLIH